MTNTVAVARAGKNVLTEPDPNNFIFHSAYNTFKILKQEKHVINVLTGSNWYTIAHTAIKTPPLFLLFIQFPDGKATPLTLQSIKSYNNAENGGDAHSINAMYWDNTNIYIFIATVGTAYTVTLIFYEFEPELV